MRKEVNIADVYQDRGGFTSEQPHGGMPPDIRTSSPPWQRLVPGDSFLSEQVRRKC